MYPAITLSSGAITSTADKVSDRLESRIEIIQVGDNGTDLFIWVKNVGSSEIQVIDYTDVFFGPSGDFYRVVYGGDVAPYWEYDLEGGKTRWKIAVTNKITIHPETPISSGTFLVKVVIPNGIHDELLYTVD